MLPQPPSHLPPSEWNNPSKMSARSSPDVASSHATLPAGYNPYVDGDSYSDQSNIERGGTNLYQKSIRERNTVKYNATFDKDSVEYFRPRKVPKEDMPTSSPWVFSGRRPEGGRRPSLGSQTDPSARGGARPKHVPRKRFAWSSEQRTENNHGENSQQYLGQRLNPPPLPARNQFTEKSDDRESRQTQEYQNLSHLNAGVKRKANLAFHDEAGPSNYPPETSTDRSFNNSVLSIRAKLRQASEPSQAYQNQHVTHSRQGSSLQNDSNRGMNKSTSRGSVDIPSVSANTAGTSRTRTAAIPGTVSQSQTSRQSSTTRRRI
ncbi:hypothetical protein BSL78_25303 [Apostichopus japonicus]|uniref:Uncharacterized protein n=1 Tax=Stichopus japonicus TaxID=307972 RepID=A0A2G8JQ03_STIJA|nr:hypothetical protein BSL78_25303 [Apostichopus japonicus]